MFKNNNTAREDQAPSPETSRKEKSKTVPNMTLPLGELLRRHAGGQNITTLQPEYQATDEYDELVANIGNMSEMDRLDLSRRMKTDNDIRLKDLEASQKIIKAKAKKLKDDQDKANKEFYKTKVIAVETDGLKGEKKV